jgi:hypothetical protein
MAIVPIVLDAINFVEVMHVANLLHIIYFTIHEQLYIFATTAIVIIGIIIRWTYFALGCCLQWLFPHRRPARAVALASVALGICVTNT